MSDIFLSGQSLGQFSNYISNIRDASDSLTSRMRIDFTNGLGLSVITGTGAYVSKQEPYEIACFGSNGEFDKTLFDADDRDKNGNDDVLGYCTAEKVIHYIKKLGKMEV